MISAIYLGQAMSGRAGSELGVLQAQEGMYKLLTVAPNFAADPVARTAAIQTSFKYEMSLMINQLKNMFYKAWEQDLRKRVAEDTKRRFSTFA